MDFDGRDTSNCSREEMNDSGAAVSPPLPPSSHESSEDWTILSHSDVPDQAAVEAAASSPIKRSEPQPVDSQSDIDVIEEADEVNGDTLSLKSDSVISSLSFIHSSTPRHRCRSFEHLHEDLSEASSLFYRDELPPNVDLTPGQRNNTHIPNSKFNVKLNLMMVVAVVAVIGLGIGNYIGWSSNQGLSLAQVKKLRELQDELELCMQDQEKVDDIIHDNNDSICYRDVDYWKERFEGLLRESNALRKVLEKTQKRMYVGEENIRGSDRDCSSTLATEEFRKIKLDLIVKQMEHLKLLKSFQQVKYQEKNAKKRVRALESENSFLKTRLEEEEEDDKQLEETMEAEISSLKRENEELKSKLTKEKTTERTTLREMKQRLEEITKENYELKAVLRNEPFLRTLDMELGDYEDSYENLNDSAEKRDDSASDIAKRVAMIRDRMNEMVSENEELKATIARLRYTKEVQNNVDELQEKLSALEQLVNQERQEASKWKQLYQNEKASAEQQQQKSKNDWFQIGDFRKVLMDGVLSGSEIVSEALNSIIENTASGMGVISDEISEQIGLTQEVIANLHQSLLDKWNELNELNSNEDDLAAQMLMTRMSELLTNTLRKLQDAGDKFITTQKPIESKINKFAYKIDKIFEGLDLKWEKISQKYKELKSTIYTDTNEQQAQPQPQQEPTATTADSNWYWERSRRRNEKVNSVDADGNWVLARAKNREIQRLQASNLAVARKGATWRDGQFNEYAKAKPKKQQKRDTRTA